MLEPNRSYVIEDDGSIHKMLFSGDTDWKKEPLQAYKKS